MDLMELPEEMQEELLGTKESRESSENSFYDYKGWCIDVSFYPPLPANAMGYHTRMKRLMREAVRVIERLPFFMEAYFIGSKIEIADPAQIRVKGGNMRITAGDEREYIKEAKKFYTDSATGESEVSGSSSLDFSIIVYSNGKQLDLRAAESAIKNSEPYIRGLLGRRVAYFTPVSIKGYPVSEIYEIPQINGGIN